jgi:single-stranded DNA-binding protein
MINTLIIQGTVYKLKTKQLENGNYHVSFSLGSYDSYTNKNNEKVYNNYYFWVSAVGKRARYISEHVEDGDEIIIHGKLKTWETEGKSKTFIDPLSVSVCRKVKVAGEDVPF